MSRHQTKSSLSRASNAGHLYYVRLKTVYGPMYKIGFTSMGSVYERFAYKQNGDEQLLDKVYFFAHHHEAYSIEQRLHAHFRSKKAFGDYANNPTMPLYNNGQSELYVDDILGLDPDFTAAQSYRTLSALPPRNARPSKENLHWSLLSLITILKWLFSCLGWILRLGERLCDAIFNVTSEKRGGLFGQSQAQKDAISTAKERQRLQDERDARELSPILKWITEAHQKGANPTVRAAVTENALSDFPAVFQRPVEAAPLLPADGQGGEQALASLADRTARPDSTLELGIGVSRVDAYFDPAWHITLLTEDEIAQHALDTTSNSWLSLIDIRSSDTAVARQSQLWDGVFFDRLDWVEDALVAGVSPDVEFSAHEIGITPVFVAAILNRTSIVRLLAAYGARYPDRVTWHETVPFVSTYEIVDAGEPANCAIYHDNIEMLRILLRMQPSGVYKDCTEPADYGWSEALERAISGSPECFLEVMRQRITLALGQASLISEASLVAITDGALQLMQKLNGIEQGGPPFRAIKKLSDSADNDETMPSHEITKIGMRFGEKVRLANSVRLSDYDHATAQVLDCNFSHSDNIPRVSFTRLPISETAFAEVLIVDQSDLETTYRYMDVALFASPSVADLQLFTVSRASANTMAKFVVGLLEGDQDVIICSLASKADLDAPLWEPRNMFRDLDLKADGPLDSDGSRLSYM